MSDVTVLGPKWVAELKAEIKQRRDDNAGQLSHCDPDGEYRKQIEMVVAEFDVMLAGPDLLAALQELLTAADNLDPQSGAPIGYGRLLEAVAAADAVILKATGEPA